jgi:hypothetical protein
MTLRPVLDRLGLDPKPEQILALRICDPAMGSGAFLVEACRQLGDHLVAAWRRTQTTPSLPRDEDVTLHAYRLIAQQCLYGIDKNPLAVDLARLSMWLVTFAKLHPFTFVDHALRHGDSLVGLSREQIASFSLDTSAGTQVTLIRPLIEAHVREAEALRTRIHAIGDPPDIAELTDLWKQAQEKLHSVRLIGDLCAAAFFARDNHKARRTYMGVLAGKVLAWLQVGKGEPELEGIVAELRTGKRPIPAFHWEIEFPEVFDARGGFDCFIGNPPWVSFSGRQAVAESTQYISWLGRFTSFSGWQSLHACFVEQSLRLTNNGGAIGIVLPATMAELDGYSMCRRVIRSMAVPLEPLVYFGESAFVGVVQPTFALVAQRKIPTSCESKAGESPLILSGVSGAGQSDALKTLAEPSGISSVGQPPGLDVDGVLRTLRLGAVVPAGAFKDLGVHTGNCSTSLIVDQPSMKSSPVREGKDLTAYHVSPPRRWLVLDHHPQEGEYFRIGDLAAYRRVPILLRQTADRPIAALHRDPTYFRNSVLACLGLSGVDDRAVVCWLNSSVVSWYHLRSSREANQKAFPQVKIKHLMSIPIPLWTSDAIDRLVRLHDERVSATGEQADVLDANIDEEIANAYGLEAKVVQALRREVSGVDERRG